MYLSNPQFSKFKLGIYFVTIKGMTKDKTLLTAEIRDSVLLNLNKDNRLHLRKPHLSGRLN